MHFSCEKSLLLNSINIVSKIIPQKSSMPALDGILLELYDDGKLKLTGFDLEVGIETYMTVDLMVPGKLIVNAKIFGEIIRKIDDETVFLQADEKLNLTISSGVIKFIVPCLNADIYPDLPIIEKSNSFKLKQSILHSMIRQTIFSVSTNEAKPILKGILFDIIDNEIYIVSSDTIKMAIRKESFENNIKNNFSFIVPGKALSELIKIMNDSDDEIYIGLSSHHITFEFDNAKIISRLIEGEFINYKSIIPKSFKSTIKIKLSDFQKAIERASILISEKARYAVRCSFEFDSIIISCKTADGHSLKDEIRASIEGDNLEIGFNNKYLLDILNACECDEICIGLNSPMTSICITPVDNDKFIFLISPMRLRNE